MRLMFIGDVVGKSGRSALETHLPQLIEDLSIDFTVVNGENAAGGFGITEKIFHQFCDLGADAVTLGNHSWDQKEALVFIEREPRLIRPINFPKGTPGRGANVFVAKNSARVLVINALGRLFMEPLDDPFKAIDDELDACSLGQDVDAVLIDFHAEATSETVAVGHFCDGRASLVVGTHTHIPTADYQILPSGTAFQSDAGMTGDYDSVIGMDKEEPLHRFTKKISSGRFEPADGEATICGLVVQTNDKTGLAESVSPIRLGGRLSQHMPDFDN